MKIPKLTAKTLLSAVLLSGALAASTLYSPLSLAEGGADVGGGNGSPAKVVRITAIGLDALAELSEKEPIVIKGRTIDVKAMQEALADLKEIRPTTEKLPDVNGKPVCMTNHPGSKALSMNVDCFDGYDADTQLQMGIHEVWGLAFNDKQDDTYFYSAKLVQKIKNRAPASEEALSDTARVVGSSFKIVQPKEYEGNELKINQQVLDDAELNASLNCSLADGIPRSETTAAISVKKTSLGAYILQAEGSIRCEIARAKALSLLGIRGKVAEFRQATNYTKNGRAALLAAATEGKVERASSKECLTEAIKANREIAKDPDLQKIKKKIEEKIGPFSLTYELTMGIYQPGPHYETPKGPYPGMLSVYTSNPELLQVRKGKTIDFNNMYFRVRGEVYKLPGKSISLENVKCSVEKETVKRFLEVLDDYLSDAGDELAPDEDVDSWSAK